MDRTTTRPAGATHSPQAPAQTSQSRPQTPQSRPPAPQPRGTDRPEDRPGVPMEASPRPAEGASWTQPPRQGDGEHLHRAGLDRLTPVYGTAQPPRGVSGLLRRRAYRIPEHFARHWALLMLADRVDVLEDRLGAALAQPLDSLGLDGAAGYARTNPVVVIAGAVVGGWVAKKVIF